MKNLILKFLPLVSLSFLSGYRTKLLGFSLLAMALVKGIDGGDWSDDLEKGLGLLFLRAALPKKASS